VQIQQQHEVMDINQQPSSLVTLSGEVIVVEPESSSPSSGDTLTPPGLQIQFKSDFATAVLVLDQALPNAVVSSDDTDKKICAKLYYEIQLVTGGLAQIGWASLVPADSPPTAPNGSSDDKEASLSATIRSSVVFAPNNDLGDGVGDDGASFAFDGSRGKKFHAGHEESYGGTSSRWKAGDVVGCRYDLGAGIISYSLNGQELGVAFTLPQQQPPLVLFPAVSCNAGEIVTWHVRQEECLYFPDSATAVHDLIVGSGTPTETTSTDNDDDINETIPMLPSIPVDNAVITHVAPKAVTVAVEDKPLPAAVIILPEPLDLEPFSSATALEELGMGRLMSALMAEQCKCGYVVKWIVHFVVSSSRFVSLCPLNLLWMKTSGLSQNLPLVCSNERWSVWSICMAYTPSFYPHSFVQNLFLPTQRNSFRTCGTTLLLERFETKRVSKEGPSQGVCTVGGYHRTIS
jgi:hypothetical protein